MGNNFRIGIICGKLGGTDGVSLEADKWIEVLKKLGHTIYTIAGKYVTPLQNVNKANQFLIEEIRFNSPEQQQIEKQVFPFLGNHKTVPEGEKRSNKIIDTLKQRGKEIARDIYELIQKNNIDVIIAENTNAMPMTLLGATAVYSLAMEYRVATIFHHHDFWWERSRFSNNRIESLLNQIMPPNDLGVEHSVLTSYSAHILRSLKRVQPFVIPNCEDFEHPVTKDEYNSSFRKDLGFKDDDILIVQPTRIIRRKRIEDSLELIRRFLENYPEYEKRVHYIISLYQGDEPDDNYVEQIIQRTETLGIPLHFISERVSARRGSDSQGRKLYTNRDVLAQADMVTYLPIWEGFGNALLEAIACRVPVITTTYLVYKTDIKVTGINNIEIRDLYDESGHLIITDEPLKMMDKVIKDSRFREELVENNFSAAKKEFSMDTLTRKLDELITQYSDEIKASRKRIGKTKVQYSV